MSKVTQLPASQQKRGTYRYASLVLDAWDRLFGDDDRLTERERRRERKEHKSQVEQAAKQRL